MSIRNMMLIGLFAALQTVSSQVSIPIGPVPVTLQVMFVLLAGMVLGSRRGCASVALWAFLGVLGLPVFAQGKAGFAVLIGPTGGFIFGMTACAYLVGWAAERLEMGYGRAAGIMLAGLTILYGLGLIGFLLSFQYVLQKPMTLEKAMALAVWPFIPFDLLKAAAAAYLGVRIRRSLSQAGLLMHSSPPLKTIK